MVELATEEGVLVPDPNLPLRLYLRTKSVVPSDENATDKSSTGSGDCGTVVLRMRPIGSLGRDLTKVGVPAVDEAGEAMMFGPVDCQLDDKAAVDDIDPSEEVFISVALPS